MNDKHTHEESSRIAAEVRVLGSINTLAREGMDKKYAQAGEETHHVARLLGIEGRVGKEEAHQAQAALMKGNSLALKLCEEAAQYARDCEWLAHRLGVEFDLPWPDGDDPYEF